MEVIALVLEKTAPFENEGCGTQHRIRPSRNRSFESNELQGPFNEALHDPGFQSPGRTKTTSKTAPFETFFLNARKLLMSMTFARKGCGTRR